MPSYDSASRKSTSNLSNPKRTIGFYYWGWRPPGINLLQITHSPKAKFKLSNTDGKFKPPKNVIGSTCGLGLGGVIMQSLKTLSREVPASACSLGCLRFCPDALHYYSAGPSIYPVDSTFHCPAAGGVGLKAAGPAPPLLPPGSNELGFYYLLVLGCVVSARPAGCLFTV